MSNGPYFFAWVNAGDSTFGSEHLRFDEKVLAFDIQHEEGNFATLSVTVKNPRVGFLAPGRKQWVWLAWDRGFAGFPVGHEESESASGETLSESGRDIVPLFFGRLVAIPQDLQGDTLTLSFLARPPDFVNQKAVLAESLKVMPFYDPLFIDPGSLADPDTVLEARTALWHIDRITHEVTISDILNGEEAAVDFGPDKVIYESLGVTYGEAPIRAVQMAASVAWSQVAKGTLDITRSLINAFAAVSSGNFAGNLGKLTRNLIASYTGGGLVSAWPKRGAAVNNGWQVDASVVTTNDPGVPTELLQGPNTVGVDPATVNGPPGSKMVILRFPDGEFTHFATSSQFAPAIMVPLWWMRPALRLSYDTTRDRTETMTFTLNADVQAVMTDESDQEVVSINRMGARADMVLPDVRLEASESEPSSSSAPIFDSRRRSYFTTDRGRQSVDYLVLLARATLLARARTVRISFDVPFVEAVEMNCRKSVALHDPRLPKGRAFGKVVGYQLSLSGSDGLSKATITIACAIGHGGEPTEADGTPVYADNDYVEDGYQQIDGRRIILPSSDVTVTDYDSILPNDDGVDFITGITPDKMIAELDVLHGAEEQAEVLEGAISHSEIGGLDLRTFADPAELITALNHHATRVKLRMVPVDGGPFTTDYPLTLSELSVPKMIDLEAPDDVESASA